MDPPAALIAWLRTCCGAASGAWSGIRSTVTLTAPPPESQASDPRPVNVTVAAPVYPELSPMMATTRLFALSAAALIAVLPT